MSLVALFKRSCFICVISLIMVLRPSHAFGAPPADETFEHYTVALSWLPGFCDVSHKCKASQTHDVLIGLHGVWPSEPQSFVMAGVPEKLWTRRGCRSLARATWQSSRPLSDQTRRAYNAIIADTGFDLIDHEVDKHLACLSIDPDSTIRTGIQVRNAFDTSPVGAWLHRHAGESASRKAFFNVVAETWTRLPRGAIVLRCRRDSHRRPTLVSLELGLDAHEITSFPDTRSFIRVAGRRSSCPEKFWLQGWSQ